MARRKNKKQTGSKPRAGAESQIKTEISGKQQSIKSVPARDEPPARGNKKKTAARPGGIAPATCFGGMFLSLILGLYLGTLMPGIIEDMSRPAPVAQAEKPRESPPAMPPATVEKAPQKQAEIAVLKEQQTPEIPPGLGKRIAELESIVGGKDDNVAALVELGNLYFDTNQPRKAIKVYENALAIAPNNADVLTDLGIMYREEGNYPKALECFREATRINPAHENAMFNEGVVLYHDLKRKEDARAAWIRLLGVNPHARTPDGKSVAEMITNLE